MIGAVFAALWCGLAAAYLYYLAAHATILDRVMARPRDRWPMLIGCPWCLGFWLTGFLLWLTGNYDPVTHLASATVVGVVGGLAS